MEQICARWAKIGPKIGFLPFVKFSSLVFLEIIYNDSLQQCITSSWGKTHEKNWEGGGSKFGPEQAEIVSRSRFFAMFNY